MTSSPTILFLDTNILLHFKSLREIDWLTVAGAKAVRLVLCSPVLDELDKHKYDPRRKDRAETADGEIQRIEIGSIQLAKAVAVETLQLNAVPDSAFDISPIPGGIRPARAQEYLEQFRNHVQCVHIYNEIMKRTISFSLWAANTGTQPAEKVEFEVIFPECFAAVVDRNELEAKREYGEDHSDIEKLFMKPTPPPRPEPEVPFAIEFPPRTFKMPRLAVSSENVVEVNRADDMYTIRISVRSIKHHPTKPECIGSFYGLLRPGFPLRTAAQYEIWMDNHPDTTTGQLLFGVVDDGEVSAPDAADEDEPSVEVEERDE